MATKSQIARLKAHYRRHDEMSAEWASRGYCYPPPRFPEFPQDLASRVCGAKTRAGTPCKQKAIYDNGRCKFHGGLATGPTTEAGKEQARIAVKQSVALEWLHRRLHPKDELTVDQPMGRRTGYQSGYQQIKGFRTARLRQGRPYRDACQK